jgi:hypothetical protein
MPNLEKALACSGGLGVGHAWLHFSAKMNKQMMTPFQLSATSFTGQMSYTNICLTKKKLLGF